MADELGNSLSTMGSGITTALSNPITSGAVGLAGGAVLGSLATSSLSGTKRSKRRTSRKRNNSHRKRKHKQKKPYTAGKGKDRSTRRIRYTKNNQPYVILANGRARFISKRSASSSKKRKGGRY